MLSTLLCAVTLAATPQTVNGIKPVPDGTREYAQAFAKYSTENPATIQTPDFFTAGYFTMRAKTLAALVNTKYTAAHAGICGTMLGLYDPELGKTIKAASDRIVKGSKDFDSFTNEEQDAIGKAAANPKSPIYPFDKERVSSEKAWAYFAGSQLGTLSAYVTAWHISPKQKVLLEWIDGSLKACAEQAGKAGNTTRKEVADQLKEFSKWEGKTLDEVTMREIGGQVQKTLRAATPEKYRW